MGNLYCITGLIVASSKFAREESVQKEFEKQLKEKHIDESLNLITEEDFINLLSEHVASHCISKLFEAIFSEYKKLGYEYSKTCVKCGLITHN